MAVRLARDGWTRGMTDSLRVAESRRWRRRNCGPDRPLDHDCARLADALIGRPEAITRLRALLALASVPDAQLADQRIVQQSLSVALRTAGPFDAAAAAMRCAPAPPSLKTIAQQRPDSAHDLEIVVRGTGRQPGTGQHRLVPIHQHGDAVLRVCGTAGGVDARAEGIEAGIRGTVRQHAADDQAVADGGIAEGEGTAGHYGAVALHADAANVVEISAQRAFEATPAVVAETRIEGARGADPRHSAGRRGD